MGFQTRECFGCVWLKKQLPNGEIAINLELEQVEKLNHS